MADQEKANLNALLQSRSHPGQSKGVGARPKEKHPVPGGHSQAKGQDEPTTENPQPQKRLGSTQEDAHLDQLLSEISMEESSKGVAKKPDLKQLLINRSKRKNKHSGASSGRSSVAPQSRGRRKAQQSSHQVHPGASADPNHFQSISPPSQYDLPPPNRNTQPAAPAGHSGDGGAEAARVPLEILEYRMPDLPWPDFPDILEEARLRALSVPDPITEDESICTIWLIDASESMRGRPLEYAKGIIRKFIDTVRQLPISENMAVVVFGGRQLCVLQHLTCDLDRIIRALDRVELGGCSPMSLGIALGVTTLEAAPRRMMTKKNIFPRMMVLSDFRPTHEPDDTFNEYHWRKSLMPALKTVGAGVYRHYQMRVHMIPCGDEASKEIPEELWVPGQGQILDEPKLFWMCRFGFHSRLASHMLDTSDRRVGDEEVNIGDEEAVRDFAEKIGYRKYFVNKDEKDEVSTLHIIGNRISRRITFYKPEIDREVPPPSPPPGTPWKPFLWDGLPPFEVEPEDSSSDDDSDESDDEDQGPDLPIMPNIGLEVEKGFDWIWRHIGVPNGAVGKVTRIIEEDPGWIEVVWDSGQKTDCRYGIDGEFDVLPRVGRGRAIRWPPGREREVKTPEIPPAPDLPPMPDAGPEPPPGNQSGAENNEMMNNLIQEILRQGQGGQQGQGLQNLFQGLGQGMFQGGQQGQGLENLFQGQGHDLFQDQGQGPFGEFFVQGMNSAEAQAPAPGPGPAPAQTPVQNSAPVSDISQSLRVEDGQIGRSVPNDSNLESDISMCTQSSVSMTTDTSIQGSLDVGSFASAVPRNASSASAQSPPSSIVDDSMYVWQWRDERGEWRTFSKDAIEKLETSFHQNHNGTCFVKQGQHWVRVIFQKMKLRNSDLGTESEVQRIEVDPSMMNSLERAVT